MCQLLGVSANIEVDLQLSLREFKHRGEANPHGWGLAHFHDSKWTLIKEPRTLAGENIEDERFRFRSRTIVGHVRLRSCGSVSHVNTHPFVRGNWAFAHNGTISAIKKRPEFKLTKYRREGGTDSEHAFCYLLEKIEERPNNIVKVLEDEAEKICELGAFNFLLSDGETLYTYGDHNLWYVAREHPFRKVQLKYDRFELELSDIKDAAERAILVATEPLTEGEDWKRLTGLMKFTDGKMAN